MKLQNQKFQVEIFLENISIGIAFPCQLSVIWKKGTTELKTKTNPILDQEKCEALFNEKLTMSFSLQFDPKTKKFVERMAKLIVHIMAESSVKMAGTVALDLSVYAAMASKEHKLSLPLARCPDSEARMNLSLKMTQISEMDDTLSNSALDSSIFNGNDTSKSFDGVSRVQISDLRTRIFQETSPLAHADQNRRSNRASSPNAIGSVRSKSPTIHHKNTPKISLVETKQEEKPKASNERHENQKIPSQIAYIRNLKESLAEYKPVDPAPPHQMEEEAIEIEFDTGAEYERNIKESIADYKPQDLMLVNPIESSVAHLQRNSRENVTKSAPPFSGFEENSAKKTKNDLSIVNETIKEQQDSMILKEEKSNRVDQFGLKGQLTPKEGRKMAPIFGKREKSPGLETSQNELGNLSLSLSKREKEKLEEELQGAREREKQMKEEFRKEIEKKNLQIDQMETEMDILTKEVFAKKETIEKLQSEISMQGTQFKIKIEELSQDLKAASKKQERNSDLTANSRNAMAQYAQQIKELKKKLAESEMAREQALSMQTGLTLEVERYQKELERTSKASIAASVDASRERELLQENIELKKHIESLKLEITLNQNECVSRECEEDIQIEVDNEQLITNIQNELVLLQQKCDGLREKKSKLKSELKELKERLTKKESEDEGKPAKKNFELVKRLVEKQSEIKKLQRALDELQEFRDKALELEGENQLLKGELETTRENKKSQKESGKIKEKLEKTEEENTTMKEEIEKLRIMASKLEIEKKKLENSLKKAEEQLRELRESYEKLEVDFILMKRNVGDALNIGAEINDSVIFDRLTRALCNTNNK